jgi:hypothetical protein
MDCEFYKNGKIYKIVCNRTGKVYIGSTCKSLSGRLAGHRSNYNSFLKNNHNYVSSFEVLENADYSIVLIEECKAKNKMELHQRERHFIDTIDCVNKYIPSRSKKEYNFEYRQNNKEKIKEYYRYDIDKSKENYINNIDKIKEYRMQHNVCQCGGTYTNAHKQQHLKSKMHMSSIDKCFLSSTDTTK